MPRKMTYRELFERLKQIGYTDQKMEVNGVPAHVLFHKEIERATIILPQRPLREHVHAMHLAAVRAVLRNHGVAVNGQEPELLTQLGQLIKE
jgi:hypothetical protein